MDASSWKFSQALLTFDSKAEGANALLAALDADLAAGVEAATLSQVLERHNGSRPLPAKLYQTLVGRLQLPVPRLDDPTIDLDAPARQYPPGGAAPTVPVPGSPVAGRYRLLELLGRGGTSEVYKAIDLQRATPGDTDYYVAIKLLLRRNISPESLGSIEQHLTLLKRLVHPNVARPLDWGLLDEVFYIALEYVPGRTLYDHIRLRPILRSEAVLIVSKIADGLEAAHQQSIVHGDLKPGNILVTDGGEVRLIDFGWEGSPRRPAVTPRYASPQRLQRAAPDAADDVFALACIAFELFTGQPAFSATASSRGDGHLPPTDQLNETQSAAFRHALDPDRSKRTADARQFVRELLLVNSQDSRSGWVKWLPVVLIVGVALGFLLRQVLLVPHPVPAPPQAMIPATSPEAASSEPGTIIRDCPTCTALRVIPPGELVRGADADDKTVSDVEKPRQSITLAAPLALAIDAITVAEFQSFVNETGRVMQGCEIYDGKWHVDPAASWQNPGFAQTPLHPVTCVSWEDATAYAAWLSQKAGHRYRLPSAAEWEYAARAGSAGVVPWDAPGDACRSANVADQSAARRYPGFSVFSCDDNYVNTAPVGSYAANAFGLHDMLGNVFAWTQDCWSDSYAGAPQDGSARLTANCSEHELRGGSWFSSPAVVRASYRNHFEADYRGSSVGIRLVRELTP